MVLKHVRNGVLVTLATFAFACSSTQQQEDQLALQQEEGNIELNEDNEFEQQETGNEYAEQEGGENYENTAGEGNEYAEENFSEENLAENTSEEGINEIMGDDSSMNETMANDSNMENVYDANSLEENVLADDTSMDAMEGDSMEAEPAMASTGSGVVMYISADMVNVYGQPDQASAPVAVLNTGDPVLAEVSGSFAKIGEGKYVTIDSLSEGVVARTPAANPWR